MDIEGGVAARYVGQTVARKEDQRLLTGQGRFVDDISLPGMLHAAFVRSPIARGRIKGIDAAAARALPGVHAVYTGADLNALVKAMRPMFWPGAVPFPRLMPLSDLDVRFVGDAVALVVAEDRYVAEDAAELVEVDYEAEDPVLDYLAAEGAPPVHPEIGSNVLTAGGSPPDPELEAIFAGAPHVIEETFHQQTHVALPLETRGILAAFGPEELTIWIAAQSPQLAVWRFAEAFGMPRNRVRALAYDVGGAFGLKAFPNRDEVAVAAAAKRIRRPVKWIEDRMENLVASSHSRRESASVKFAFDRDFRILAAHLDHKSNSGAYPWAPTSGPKVAETFPGPYRIPKYGFKHAAYYTNTCGRGAYRGPWMFETVARESFMDVAARRLGVDPLELRRRNVILQADQPYKSATGIVFDRVSPERTLEQVAKSVDIAAFRAEQAAARKEGRYLGLGMSVYMEPTAVPIAFMSHNVAEICIEPSGDAVVRSNAHSQGQSTETTLAQIVADELGMDLDKVRVLQGDSSQAGFGMGAGGSRQAVIGGGAVKLTAHKLREKLLAIASHMLEAAPEDLSLRDGEVFVTGVPDMSVSIQKIAELAYHAVTKLPQGMEPGLEAHGRYTPESTTWANAAHACIVEVDVNTGMVRILRWVVSEDCGVMINPAVVDGQISGGLVQAIGGVLLEEAPYDERGNPLAVTLKDYLVPLAPEVPVIEFSHVCTPSATPGGFKGAGEGGAIIGPPTLINAISDALAPFKVRLNRLPLSPDRIVSLLHHDDGQESLSGGDEMRYAADAFPFLTDDVKQGVAAFRAKRKPEVK